MLPSRLGVSIKCTPKGSVHIILYTVAVAILFINIPFGYWRALEKRLSLKWFLAIHIPIVIAIILRILTGIGWEPSTFLIFIAAFVLGQYLGGEIHLALRKPKK